MRQRFGTSKSVSFEANNESHSFETKPSKPWRTWDFKSWLFAGVPPSYSTRKKVKILLLTSSFGHFWDIIQTILSMVACALYIMDTYSIDTGRALEMLLTLAFTADYLLRFYVADNRKKYPLTFNALIDALTIFPVYLEMMSVKNSPRFSFLRFARVLRIIRILRIFKILRTMMSGVKRQLWTMVLTISSIIFLSAGLLHMVEHELILQNSCDDVNGEYDDEHDGCPVIRNFGDSIYFIIVTISTVGYGEFYPVTPQGKFLVCAMIIFSLILVPAQARKLAALIQMQSPYRQYFAPLDTPHVLVVGSFTVTVLREFLQEFFHPDRFHSTTQLERHVVIMAGEDPGEALLFLINSPMIEGKVTYIKGSVMNEADLYRVGADRADACFVLCDKYAENKVEEDRRSVLFTLALEEFNPNLRVFVEILEPNAKMHVLDADVDVVLCVDELKMNVLAQACLCPGLATIITILCRTFAEPPIALTDHTSDSGFPRWKTEYLTGCSLEIYRAPLPACFDNMSFSRAAMMIYSKLGIFLLGIESKLGAGLRNAVHINPGWSYRIPRGARGFFLAPDISTAMSVSDVFANGMDPEEMFTTKSPARRLSSIWKGRFKSFRSKTKQKRLTPRANRTFSEMYDRGIHITVSPYMLDLGSPTPVDREYDADLLHHGGRELPTAAPSMSATVSTSERDLRSSPHHQPSDQRKSRSTRALYRADADESDPLQMSDPAPSNAAASVTPNRWSVTPTRCTVPPSHGSREASHSFTSPNGPSGVKSPGRPKSLITDLQEMGLVSPQLSPGVSSKEAASKSPLSMPTALLPDGSKTEETVAYLEDHVIVSGRMEALDTFILSIHLERKQRGLPLRDIVILDDFVDCPTAPPPWLPRVMGLEKVHFVRGSPCVFEDLIRAGVQTARSCVVISDSTQSSPQDDDMIDTSAIFVMLTIENVVKTCHMAPQFFPLVELSSASNMRVMNAKLLKRKLGNIDPSIKQNLLVLNSISTSQNFFQNSGPCIAITSRDRKAEISAAKQMQRRRTLKHVSFNHAEGVHTMSMFASGFVFSTDAFDTLLCHAYYNPPIIRFFLELLSSPTAAADVHCSIRRLPIHPSLVGQTFGELFQYYVTGKDLYVGDAIPIALYRHPHAASRTDPAPLPYVFMGPPPSTIVSSGDLVYLLGRFPSRVMGDALDVFGDEEFPWTEPMTPEASSTASTPTRKYDVSQTFGDTDEPSAPSRGRSSPILKCTSQFTGLGSKRTPDPLLQESIEMASMSESSHDQIGQSSQSVFGRTACTRTDADVAGYLRTGTCMSDSPPHSPSSSQNGRPEPVDTVRSRNSAECETDLSDSSDSESCSSMVSATSLEGVTVAV